MEMYTNSAMLVNLVGSKQEHFQNQNPRIGKTLSKTWGMTFEILNAKGTAPTDYSILQQEERDWLNKAIIDNNGRKVREKKIQKENGN